MWIAFVVGSRPCSEGSFKSTPVFLLHKNQHFEISIRFLRATLINLELTFCYFPLIFLPRTKVAFVSAAAATVNIQLLIRLRNTSECLQTCYVTGGEAKYFVRRRKQQALRWHGCYFKLTFALSKVSFFTVSDFGDQSSNCLTH